jgi:hypothetical protein
VTTGPLALNITVPELDETLRDIEGINEDVLAEMASTMRRAVDIAEASIVQYTPVGVSGDLRRAWGTTVTRGVSMVKGVISNPLDYALWAEKGRGPGKWPPRAPIELWVRRKLGISPPESHQVAFLVARAIGRRGTKGAHMAEKGLSAVKGVIEADFLGVPDRVAFRVNSS